MADLTDLIARLEKAPGPDRELDVMCAMAAGQWAANDPPSEWARIALETAAATRVVFDEDGGEGRAVAADEWGILRYTASIDAALTLVPDRLLWRVAGGTLLGAASGAASVDAPTGRVQAEGVTPAIALCIAALKARQVSDG